MLTDFQYVLHVINSGLMVAFYVFNLIQLQFTFKQTFWCLHLHNLTHICTPYVQAHTGILLHNVQYISFIFISLRQLVGTRQKVRGVYCCAVPPD